MKPSPEKTGSWPKLDLAGLLLTGIIFIVLQLSWKQILPPGEENIWGIQNSLKFWLLARENCWDLYRQFTLSTPPSAFTLFLPVAYLAAASLYNLWGFSLQITALASLLFIFPLLYGLYGTGFFLGGRPLAWSAVFLALGNPRTLFWGKFFNLNFPEMALFSLLFYFLLRSRNFSQKNYSILFGLTLGVGLLTKYVAVYLLIPLLWTLFSAIREDRRSGNRRLFWGLSLPVLGIVTWLGFKWVYQEELFYFIKARFILLQILAVLLCGLLIWKWHKTNETGRTQNFSLSLLTGALTALPWYLGTVNILIPKAQIHLALAPQQPYLLNSLHYFLVCLQYFFPGFLLWLLGGLLFILLSRGKYPGFLLLVSSLGGLLLLSWIIVDPAYRYFLSLSILFVYLGIYWLKILNPRQQSVFAAVFALWFCLNLGALALIGGGGLPASHWLLKTAERIIAVSDYPVTPKSKKFPGLNLADIASLTPPETVFKDIAREIAAHQKGKPERGLNLIFLNLVNQPRLYLGNWQLEIYLWDNGFLPSRRISAPGENEFVSLEEFRRAGNGIRENQNLEFFPHYRFEGKWDYCLIAEPEAGNFPAWEQKLTDKGLKPKLLRSYPLQEQLWSRELNLQLRLYALSRG